MPRVVRVQVKHQITLPKEVRERLSIAVGDLLEVEARGGKIVMSVHKLSRRNGR